MNLPVRGADTTLRSGVSYYDDSDLAPTDLVSVCKLPSYQHYRVTDYGADPTGSADSTMAIRAAISDAKANGSGIIYFPAGTYAVCPQASDPVTEQQPVFPISSNNIIMLGEGAGTTILKFYCLGITNPITTWRVTGGSYAKISRGGIFNFDWNNNTPRFALSGFQVRSMTLDGQLPYTGNNTVGGDPTTGDGWDLSHKAILLNGQVSNILVFNCDIKNWHGEEIYAGGSVGKMWVVNTQVHGCNASVVSCSADFVGENLTVGGTNPGDDVYNGFENYASIAGQQTRLTNSIVCPSSDPTKPHGNGIVLIGCPGTSAFLQNNQVTNSNRALLMSEALNNLTIDSCIFYNNTNTIVNSILNLYPGLITGWSNIAFTNNTADKSGMFFTCQSPGTSWDGFIVTGNTITNGRLLSGNWGSSFITNQTLGNNTFGVGASDTGTGNWSGKRLVWNTDTNIFNWPGDTNLYEFGYHINDGVATSTSTTFAPRSGDCVLNSNQTPNTTPHYAVIDPTTLILYPIGYTVRIHAMSKPNWYIKADTTNSLTQDTPVPINSFITLVFDGKLFNLKQ